MATVELKLTSDLFDKVVAGHKTSTIRRPGKVKAGDLITFVEVIGDADTIRRSGELIPEGCQGDAAAHLGSDGGDRRVRD